MAGCCQKGAFSHIVVPSDDRVTSSDAVTSVNVTSPSVREEIAEGFGRCTVWHFRAAVEHVGEVFEEVDFVQSAGAGQGVEDGTALRSGVAAEEQGVLP